MSKILLGINIDHVATLREARKVSYPDPLEASKVVALAGADQVVLHLREDRRHIQDHDLERIKLDCPLPINLELAATDEMVAIACKTGPYLCTFVPERRAEITTEGGLDLISHSRHLMSYMTELTKASVLTAFFIDANKEQIEMAREMGAGVVELHTGHYCNQSEPEEAKKALQLLKEAAQFAKSLGIKVAAGHGLTCENISPLLREIPEITEYNIGHSIIARSLFVGLKEAIGEMRRAIQNSEQGGKNL